MDGRTPFDTWDSQGQTYGESQQQTVGVIRVEAGASSVELPGGSSFLRADYARDGFDLLLDAGSDGSFVLPDYFLRLKPPDLVTEDGAVLPHHIVRALAGPMAPGQVAQAGGDAGIGLGAPIGSVSEAEGAVTVLHPDGVEEMLSTGSPIFQGDVLETGSDGSVSVIFVDDTVFSLDTDGRMVMDEMVYDPGTETGAFNAMVVQGVFSFVSGQVAKTSPEGMVVNTPTATIGIRGSTVVGNAAAEGSENKISLVRDVDGNVGEIIISNGAGQLVLNQAGASTTVFSATAAPGPMEILTQAEIQQSFGGSLTRLVKTVAKQAEQKAVEAEEDAAQAEADAEAAKAEADAAKAEAEAAAAEAEAAAAEAEAALAEAEAAGDAEAIAEAEAQAAAAAEAAAEAEAAAAAAEAAEAEAVAAEAEAAAAAAAAEQAQAFSSMASTALTVQVAAEAAVTNDPATEDQPDETPDGNTADTADTADTVTDTQQQSADDAALQAAAEAAALAAAEAEAAAQAAAAAAAEAAALAAAEAAAAAAEAAAQAAADAAAREQAEADAVNSSPIAVNETLADQLEDARSITGNVLGTDADGDALTYTLEGTPVGGTVNLSSNGSYTFTLTPDYNGVASFNFSASDGQASSPTATVSFNVTAVNDAPVVMMSASGGQGALSFSNSYQYETLMTGFQGSGSALADVDGDGDLDIILNGGVTTNGQPWNTYVGLNDGSGTFTYSQAISGTYGNTNTYFRSIDVGDVNGDGKLDFVAINNEASFKAVYLGDGTGGFTATNQTFDFTGGTTGGSNLKMADLDGDGDLDIWANIDTGNRVYLNDGSGTFTDTGQSLILNTTSYRSVDFGDVDGDGDLDAVTGSWADDINVWLNDGSANFTNTGVTGTGLVTNTDATNGIALGDLDGDGDLDIFAFDRGAGGNKVFLNNGSGSFTNSGQVLGATTGGDTVRQDGQLVDIDNDGDLDAISATDGQMEVFINDGSATFTQNALGVGGGWSTEVRAGDLNGDGLLDVLVNNYAAGSHILTNTTPNYADTMTQGGSITLNAGSTPHLSAVDVDGDTPLTYTVSAIPTNGTLSVDGVVMALDGLTTFTQAQLDAGSVVYNHAGTATTSDAFTFTVSDGAASTATQTFNLSVNALPSGTYTNASGSTLNISANITPTTVVNDGTLNITDGVISAPSTITNNATMNFTGGSLLGNITNSAGAVLNFSSIGTVVGTVTNDGTLNVTTGAKRFDAFVNNGVLNIASGVTFEGSYNNYPVMNVGSSIQGDGTFKTAAPGAYTYNGIWNPGTDGTVGSLTMNTWDANFSRTVNMSSTTVYNVDIANSGSYDTLTLATAHPSLIDGTLNLKSISGYSPTSGDSFTILSYTTGSSGTFTVTHDFGAGWNVVANYGTTSLTLTVLSDAGAVTGTAANDTLLSLAGNDTIDGGAGADVLNLSGTLVGHTLGFAADGTLTITDTVGTDGTDTVSNVETLAFPDATVTVATEAPEKQVNTTTTGAQTNPEITMISTGGWIVSWAEGGKIMGQIYDAAGVKSGGELTLVASGVTASDHQLTEIHNTTGTSGFALSYTAADANGNGAFYKVFNDAGTNTLAVKALNTTTTLEQTNPTIVQGNDGGVFAAWVDSSTGTENIMGRFLDATGTASATDYNSGAEFILSTNNSNAQNSPDVTQLENGDIAVVWSSNHTLDTGNSNPYYSLMGRIYDQSTKTWGTEFVVASVDASNALSGSASAMMNGNIAVSWLQATGTADVYDVKYTVLDATGTTVVSTATAAAGINLAGVTHAPGVAGLENGGYVVTWIDKSTGDYDVKAAIYTDAGAVVKSPFTINTTTANDQAHPNVEATVDGGFNVVWQSYAQDGNLEGIYSQRYDATGNIIGQATLTGDASNNSFVIAAAQKGLEVVGGGGSDVVTLSGTTGQQNMIKATNISGVVGSDADDMVVFGSALNNHSVDLGAGKDTVKLADGGNIQTFQNVEQIIGGSGNDNIASSTVFAAADNAMVEGGAGTDNLNLSSAGNNTVAVEGVETINGGTATDTLSYKSGANLEGVTLNAVEAIVLDSDNNEANGLNLSAATIFNSAITITGSGGNESLSSADGIDLSNATLSGISNVYIDNDATNTVGATLTLGAQALPSGVAIHGSGGDDFIQMAGTSLDLSTATLNNISQIKGSTGNDTIVGSAGADTIFGAAGADTLTGGAGADVFVYTAASESTTAAKDSITDFTTTSDKIDVSAIAAGSFTLGTIANASGFTVQAQQTGTVVDFDTNDDGVVDMSIDVGATTLAVGDFITA